MAEKAKEENKEEEEKSQYEQLNPANLDATQKKSRGIPAVRYI